MWIKLQGKYYNLSNLVKIDAYHESEDGSDTTYFIRLSSITGTEFVYYGDKRSARDYDLEHIEMLMKKDKFADIDAWR